MITSFDEFREAHSNYSDIEAHKEDSWKKVLIILNREGWEPYEYLDFVFRRYRKPMVPSLLQSEDVVESYRTEKAERVVNNKKRADWAMDQVQTRLRNGFSIHDILKDKELESFSLLMYLIARMDKDEEAADKFKEAALYELKTMPELRDIYAIQFSRRLFPDDN